MLQQHVINRIRMSQEPGLLFAMLCANADADALEALAVWGRQNHEFLMTRVRQRAGECICTRQWTTHGRVFGTNKHGYSCAAHDPQLLEAFQNVRDPLDTVNY